MHKKKLGSSEGRRYLDIFHRGTAAVPSVKVHGARFWRDRREEIVQGLEFREDRLRSRGGIWMEHKNINKTLKYGAVRWGQRRRCSIQRSP